MANPNTALFCDNVGSGNTTSDLDCCYLNDLSSSVCQANFGVGSGNFSGGCDRTGDCIADCQKTELLYSSISQLHPGDGNGYAPIRRYKTCINIPAMAGYSRHGLLGNFSSVIEPHIPQNTTNNDLSGVTSAVTDCLSQTCRVSRNKKACINKCTPVQLLINSTTPNIEGVDACLSTLCQGGYDSLPYADADIIGIGVFAAYIMQCIFVVLFFFVFCGFDLYKRKHKQPPTAPQCLPSNGKSSRSDSEATPSNEATEQEVNLPEYTIQKKLFKDFLKEYHKTQCYFSATLQIASLAYGIFETNMLLVFMLIPLATNGVLPVIFTFLLLSRYGKASMDMTLLTIACWFLSSLVYWILYSHIIPINSEIKSSQRQFRAYEQFMYELSAIDACGGFSGLAVCPENNFNLGRDDIFHASHKLNVLTPLIWSFSTFSLIVIVFSKFLLGRRNKEEGRNKEKQGEDGGQKYSKADRAEVGKVDTTNDETPEPGDSLAGLLPHSWSLVSYWLAATCFLAGIGMQLSLLAIGTSLKMMNRHSWSFGQVVAVTVWTPPLLEWIYNESEHILKIKGDKRKRGRQNIQQRGQTEDRQ